MAVTKLEGEKFLISKLTKFANDLKICLNDLKNEYSNLAILCVGTDKIMGDAIGPIVGSNLKHLENEYLQVFGTRNNTLDFNNAKEILNNIYDNFEKPYIITIDAALSNKRKVGEIVLNKGFIKIGKALNKSICFYSNTNINCVVGRNIECGINNLEALKNVDEKSIYEMSQIISIGMEKVLKIYVTRESTKII